MVSGDPRSRDRTRRGRSIPDGGGVSFHVERRDQRSHGSNGRVFGALMAPVRADPDDLTMAAPVPAPVAAPIPFGDAPTVATWTPVSSTAATQIAAQQAAPTVTLSAPPLAPSPTGTTVVLKTKSVRGRRRIAGRARPRRRRAGGRRSATSGHRDHGARANRRDNAPAPSANPATSARSVSQRLPSPPGPRRLRPRQRQRRRRSRLLRLRSCFPPASAPAKAPAKPAAAPAAHAAPAATATAATPAAPARAIVVTTPFRFDARAVVADGDKRRERDATVVVADGTVTVTEKEKNGKALYVGPARCGRRSDILEFQAATLELTERTGRGDAGRRRRLRLSRRAARQLVRAADEGFSPRAAGGR